MDRRAETSLDPNDWDDMRELGHRMVDDMLGYLEHVRDRPAWRPMPADVKSFFRQPLSEDGIGAEAAYRDFVRYVLPYPSGNIHPRFWGWVYGTGTPLGALSDFLAATVNPNVWGNENGAAYVEGQVIDWFREIFRFPPTASGLLVTGGSVANMIGLAVGRNAKSGIRIDGDGLVGLSQPPRLYCSTETHSSVEKATVLLGLGSGSIRRIPVNRDFQVDVGALRTAIDEDRRAGFHPFAIIGNAGTVNTGAIDDLDALADLATEQSMWFHVDGAFGAMLALSPELSSRVEGISRADSLAFDLHKWLYVPFDAGCILVRDRALHAHAFSPPAGYLAHEDRGAASGEHWFNELGMELTRGFRALKVWMSLKEFGPRRYGQQIAQNVAQAQYLGERLNASAVLELHTPVTMNIVCFRVKPRTTDAMTPNALTREVLLRLQERGIAVPSATTIAGTYLIRVAICNHRTRRSDLDMLVACAEEITAEVRREAAVGQRPALVERSAQKR